MNKTFGILVWICLLAAPVYAQMGGGMMGGGMMGNGMMGPGGMGNRGYMNQPQGSQGSQIYGMLCSRCHGQGGNVIYPNLPLRGAPQLSDRLGPLQAPPDAESRRVNAPLSPRTA